MRYHCPKCEHGNSLCQRVTRTGFREVNDKLEPQNRGEVYDTWRQAEPEGDHYECGECGGEYARDGLVRVNEDATVIPPVSPDQMRL